MMKDPETLRNFTMMELIRKPVRDVALPVCVKTTVIVWISGCNPRPTFIWVPFFDPFPKHNLRACEYLAFIGCAVIHLVNFIP